MQPHSLRPEQPARQLLLHKTAASDPHTHPSDPPAQPWKPVLGQWCDQVISHLTLVFEEFLRDNGAHGVGTKVLRAGIRVPITKKTSQWLKAANLKWLAVNIELAGNLHSYLTHP